MSWCFKFCDNVVSNGLVLFSHLRWKVFFCSKLQNFFFNKFFFSPNKWFETFRSFVFSPFFVFSNLFNFFVTWRIKLKNQILSSWNVCYRLAKVELPHTVFSTPLQCIFKIFTELTLIDQTKTGSSKMLCNVANASVNGKSKRAYATEHWIAALVF